jgi:hypothetical protein
VKKSHRVSQITTTPYTYLDRSVWVAECCAGGYLFRSAARLDAAHATEAAAVSALRAQVTEWALQLIVQARRAKIAR